MKYLAFLSFTFNPYAYSYIVAAVIDVLLICFLIRRKENDNTVFWFILLLMSGFVQAFAQAFVFMSNNPETFLFWEALREFFLVISAPMIFLFTLSFVDQVRHIKKFMVLLPICLIVYLCLFFFWKTDFFISHDFTRSIVMAWGRAALVEAGSKFFGIIWGITILVCVTLIVRFYFISQEIERKKQTKFFILGFITITLGTLFLQGTLPHILNKQIFPSSVVIDIFFHILISYLLIKYGTSVFHIDSFSQNLLKILPTAVILLNKEKNITLVNNSASELFKYDNKDFKMLPVRKLFSQDQDYIVFENTIITPLTKSNNTQLLDCKVLNSHGEEFPVNMYASLIKEQQTNKELILLTITNIQIIKEKEKKLETYVKEIEEKNIQLERINKLMVGRELQIIQLKNTVNELQHSQ